MFYLSILIAILLIIIAVISNKFIKYKEFQEKKISFFESLKLCGLPVITLTSNDVDVNFLLDTGANKSFIDINVVNDLMSCKIEGKNAYVSGINDSKSETELYDIVLSYKNILFENKFHAFDFSKSFGKVDKMYGVKINGIIGSDFLNKYKYVIDYKGHIAYSE